MYICFCVYARHAGFVSEVPKDSQRDFKILHLSGFFWIKLTTRLSHYIFHALLSKPMTCSLSQDYATSSKEEVFLLIKILHLSRTTWKHLLQLKILHLSRFFWKKVFHQTKVLNLSHPTFKKLMTSLLSQDYTMLWGRSFLLIKILHQSRL